MGCRFSQCDETCTVDCGHCKGNGPPPVDAPASCAHGDPLCPCTDGDPCHYETVGGSPGLACPTTNLCTVTVPHQRFDLQGAPHHR